jgi:biotin synthase-like enzyme
MTAFDGSVTVPAICAFCPMAARNGCKNNRKINKRRKKFDRETICGAMKQPP